MTKIAPHAQTATPPRNPNAKSIAEVWIEYRATGTESARNQLLEFYLPLVRFTAERVHNKLPGEVEVDDLIQAGVFGLLDAIDAFDKERGVKFETYCAPRIRGAILDALRSMDWVPRLVRARSSQVDQACKALEMSFGRQATDEEVAARLNVSGDEFTKIRKDAGAVGVISLSRKWYDTDSNKEVREIDLLIDPRQSDPVSVTQRKDLRDMLIKGLSRAERLIIILYYYEGMTMKEIGVTLDLSESRVSQMHSSILARLKAQLQHKAKDLQSADD
jgi:RNA polymerase sigma factor for flagellar operon FliA